MAIKLDGESSHQILVSGFEGRRLREAMAFGSSMRPLIKPGAGLELEPAPAAGIRLGDIISFESRPGLSVTHRVVKIFKKQEQTFFITKGDNRLDCDGPVAEKQILGRVIRVGRHPLRSIKWRVLGICVARISYGQSVLYRSLAQSRLNRCRHRLEEKGIFPRIGIRSWFMRFSNPMSGLLPFQSALHDFRAWLLRFQLSWQGIEIQRWSAKETEGMAEVWNESFPDHRTTVERLDKMFCHSPWFDASGCFVIKKRGGGLLGWAFARDGSIDVFALTKEGWQKHADLVLFQALLGWLKRRRVRQIFINDHPIPKDPLGIPLTPLTIASSAFGFEPTEVSIGLTVTPATYHPPDISKLPEGLTIRAWRRTDDAEVNDFFQRNGRSDADRLYDPRHARPAGGTDILIAALRGSIVGFCRWILDDEIRDYSDVTWVWVLSKPDRRRGYVLRLLVDKASRSRGIAAALTARAFECLFRAGCQEIAGVVVQGKAIEHFYERFGFQKTGYFLKSRWLEKN